MYDTVVSTGQNPPCKHLKLGHQNDGAGDLWCVLAKTPHGLIPAKGKQGKAWYPFGGKEHATHDFVFVTAQEGTHTELRKAQHGVPMGTIQGHQNDSGVYHMVVCLTPHGKIPGKSNGNKAWYAYGGRENDTHDFEYVVMVNDCEKVPNRGQNPPCNKFKLGHQNDGAGDLWCVLAKTPHGLIPAKGKKGSAWYPFGGKETETHDFEYLNTSGRVHLQKSHHGPPKGTIKGHQRDSGVYHVVVCHTPHGKIPGKSNGNKAWYAYGGRENETHDFEYVVVKF